MVQRRSKKVQKGPKMVQRRSKKVREVQIRPKMVLKWFKNVLEEGQKESKKTHEVQKGSNKGPKRY